MLLRCCRKKRSFVPTVRYCDVLAYADGYFTHYMAGGNKVEIAKMITRMIKTLHEVRTWAKLACLK